MGDHGSGVGHVNELWIQSSFAHNPARAAVVGLLTSRIRSAELAAARASAKRPGERERVLLLVSETRDHGSRFANLDEVLRLIGENYISVYAVPFSAYLSQQLDALRGTNKDEWPPNMDILEKLAAIRQAMRKNIPQTLAELTGGEYRMFHTQKTFEADMIDLANNVHSRYALSFEPKNPHPGLHQIRVRLRDRSKKVTVLYRTTYWMGEEKEQ